ncbi:type II toxin-antitoxin system VapB family antitoxin [Agromyces sp. SYSU T00194]|uniref:type II toxin-antitoxin system VapB family antitoxin n=1 Tax=Agromyces chitinivorans TaxID=3158560 RepID=UPI0033947B8D
MALSIKSAEAEQLARRLAAATGESITGAITTALRERLERTEATDDSRSAQRVERLAAIGADAAGRWSDDLRTADHGDLLYDDRGLPR